jgi:hypothetical protein
MLVAVHLPFASGGKLAAIKVSCGGVVDAQHGELRSCECTKALHGTALMAWHGMARHGWQLGQLGMVGSFLNYTASSATQPSHRVMEHT